MISPQKPPKYKLNRPNSKVWDTHSGECLHTLQHSHIVRAIAFPSQPRPQILATGGFEKKLRIFDLSRSTSNGSGENSASSSPTSPIQNGSTTTPPPPPSHEIGPGVHQGPIKSIVWGPDLNIIITASDDRTVRWWDLRSRTPVSSYSLAAPVGSCELDSFSSTPSLSIAAGKNAYFFSGTTPGQLLKSVKFETEIASVAMHAEQRKFVTGGAGDTWVRVYDFDGEGEMEVHKGHHGPIWSVSFAPDGKLYATGSEDGTVKLWKFCSEPYGLWR
jgi:serine-threonine kinase receptor-associated protein